MINVESRRIDFAQDENGGLISAVALVNGVPQRAKEAPACTTLQLTHYSRPSVS